MMSRKTYSELCKLKTFEERVNYLRTSSSIGVDTFGFDRYLNQALYRSKEWKQLRSKIIMRDLGCDLGVKGYDILGRPIIHHINPITKEDVLNRSSALFDPENLITTTHRTHNLIHYGYEQQNLFTTIDRTPNDTSPWRLK